MRSSSLLGLVAVVELRRLSAATLISAEADDLITGERLRLSLSAPSDIPDSAVKDWAKQAVAARMDAIISAEIAAVLDGLRSGENALRDAAGSQIGTTHLTYQQAAAAVYARLSASSVLRDQLIGARLAATLSDSELGAVTGLDIAGVAALRADALALIAAATQIDTVTGGEAWLSTT